MELGSPLAAPRGAPRCRTGGAGLAPVGATGCWQHRGGTRQLPALPRAGGRRGGDSTCPGSLCQPCPCGDLGQVACPALAGARRLLVATPVPWQCHQGEPGCPQSHAAHGGSTETSGGREGAGSGHLCKPSCPGRPAAPLGARHVDGGRLPGPWPLAPSPVPLSPPSRSAASGSPQPPPPREPALLRRLQAAPCPR